MKSLKFALGIFWVFTVWLATCFIIGVYLNPLPASHHPKKISVAETTALPVIPQLVTPEIAKTGREIFEEADYLVKIYVVAVHNETKEENSFSGSGFLVRYNNQYCVWTAAHVVNISNHTIKELLFSLKARPGKIWTAAVDKINTELDFASLKITDPFKFEGKLAVVALGNNFEVGDDVYTLGSPLSTDYTMGRGIIMNLHVGKEQIPELRWKRLILHSANIAPGNSGGPLIDAYGGVIGINIFHLPNYASYACAIYIQDVLDWMASR